MSPLLSDLVAIATPVGVLLAYWQLRAAKHQAVASFEDSLSAQYRAILSEMPVEALLGRELSPDVLKDSLIVFYRYFDLSNEQAFLRTRSRIGNRTWDDWKEGMRQNLKLPAFQSAWREIRAAGTGAFDDLAKVIGEPGGTTVEGE